MSSALFRGRRVLWMPFAAEWKPPSSDVRLCCESMQAALAFDCEQHSDPFACADALVVYNEVLDEYGIPVHDGGASTCSSRIVPGAELPYRRASAIAGSTRPKRLA